MALREVEGFDVSYGRWGLGVLWALVGGRFGGSAGHGWNAQLILDDQPAWIIGMAARSNASSGAILRIYDGSQLQAQIVTAASGTSGFTLQVVNGAGTVLGVSDVLPNFRSWNYYEFKVGIHSTAGSFELRVNNVTVLSGTGVRTNGNANNFASGFLLTEQEWFFDDVYICDGTGVEQNDFLQDSKVQTFLPTSDGAHTAFTPDSGADQFSRLQTDDGDTSYVESAAINALDTCKLTPGTITGTVQAVKIAAVARKTDSGSRAIGMVTANGGGIQVGDDNVLTASWTEFAQLLPTNPLTSAPWVAADIVADEFGFKVTG